jgi:hypothetical protein
MFTRWNALLPLAKDELIDMASAKLTNSEPFHAHNKFHVLAMISQRFCVDPILASIEAVQLADGSVANHMRVLTSVSSDGREFHTHSPSEPVLVLGAIDILYKTPGWAPILNTFCTTLCEGGLVEKGLLGELGARMVMLIARDFASPRRNKISDVLQLIPVMNFFDKLFGNDTWCGGNRADFVMAFRYTYVNFTHWIVTKDPLPEEVDE